MSILILDLNDTRLRLFRDLDVVADGPGYAVVTPSAVVLGDAARSQFRLHPRQANNQFWHRLSMDPLASRGPNVANHADLVYRHLKELLESADAGPEDELILAVPGTTTADQLGLLLGVGQELEVAITGLVDSAIAASIASPVPSEAVHIDVSLHRATLTTMGADTDLTRQGTTEIAELGLASLLDAWVNVIADRFVTETRFDPLRIAETEQQVYDRVSRWTDAGARDPELAVDVDHQGTPRRVTVSAKALTEKAQQRYRLLDRSLDAGAPCLLSHRAAALPGLAAYLTEGGHHVSQLESTDAVEGIHRHLPLIRSSADALRFVTRLPCARSEGTTSTQLRSAPTHVALDGLAVAIGSGRTLDAATFGMPPGADDFELRLVATADGLRAQAGPGTALTLNGAPLDEPRALRRGDELRVGEHRLLLIRVDDGP